MGIFERNLILVAAGIVGFLGVAGSYSVQSPIINSIDVETSTQIQVPDQGSADASDQSVESDPIEVLKFDDAFDLQVALGMMGSQNGDALLKKDLATGRYDKISLESMHVMSVDLSAWEQGGNLILINDDSMGIAYRIGCSLSSEAGDKFMTDGERRFVKIDGAIKSYSSLTGLSIEPCVATEIPK